MTSPPDVAADATTRVAVVFPPGRGVDWWRSKHDESPVPGRWPYGLDQLAAPGVDVRPVEIPSPGRTARRLSALGIPTSRAISDVDVSLAWDERLAPAVVAGRRGGRVMCGVIWATDRVAAGEASAVADARRTLLRTDGLWCLSTPQVEALRDWLGPSAPPVSYLPFGVDTDFYAHQPITGGEPLVVSMGRDRDRDAATLFAALGMVRTALPSVSARIQATTSSKAPDGVEILPFMLHRRARDLLASASVVAVATRPNLHVSGVTVALEAMAVGRPVVLTDTPGMSDYVEHGVTGLLVPPGDPTAMAEALLGLLHDPAAAAAMGGRGRERVEQRFSTATMCAALRTLVRS